MCDGLFEPPEVVRKAFAGNVNLLSITDHDSVSAYALAAPVAKELKVDLIPACEFSTSHDGHEIHILAYFPEGYPETIHEFTKEIRADRTMRIQEGIENLRSALPHCFIEQ